MFTRPIHAFIELTTDCNNICLHCYNYKMKTKQHNHKLKANYRQVLSKLRQNGICFVTLTGGEPFLDRPLLFSIIKILIKYDIPFGINSNLTLISLDDIHFFKTLSYRPDFLTTVFSPLPKTHDKITQNPGSLNQTLNAIKLLKKHDFCVSVNMVINQLNKNQVYETGRFLKKKYGIKNFCATKAQGNVNCYGSKRYMKLTQLEILKSIHDLSRLDKYHKMKTGILVGYPFCLLHDEIKKQPNIKFPSCGAGYTSLTVTPNCDIKACNVGDDLYGNILKTKYNLIQKKMSVFKNPTKYIKACQGCAIQFSCRGGCRYEAKYVSGDLKSPDPMCQGKIDDQKFNYPKSIQINPRTQYTLNEPLKARIDSPYMLIIKKYGSWVFLDYEEFELFKRLLKIKNFSVSSLREIKRDTGIDPSMFIHKLLTNKIIKKSTD